MNLDMFTVPNGGEKQAEIRMPNSVYPDETAHYEPSHLDAHCLRWFLSWLAGLSGLIKCLYFT